MKTKLVKPAAVPALPNPFEKCVKCEGSNFEGPIYAEPVTLRGVYVPEHMEWICNRCRWIGVGPTLQTKDNWPPAAKTE